MMFEVEREVQAKRAEGEKGGNGRTRDVASLPMALELELKGMQ